MQWKDIHHVFELIALLFCIIRYRHMNKVLFMCFFGLLLTVNLVELGNHFKLLNLHHSNNWSYNLFHPIWFGLLAYIYYLVLEGPKHKQQVILLYKTYLPLVLINIVLFQGFWYLDTYTYIAGCCLMVYYASLYVKQLITDNNQVSIFKESFFWVSIGIVFFYSAEAILFSFFQYFLIINDFSAFMPVFHFFSNFLNIIYYTCISISFFCSQPRNSTL